jgi:hypothetical protein
MLVRRTLEGRLVTLCGNCATLVGRRPIRLDDLRAELRPDGDRREMDRRRGGERRRSNRRDVRLAAFYDLSERRVGGRRSMDAPAFAG